MAVKKSPKHRIVFQFELRHNVVAGPAVLEYESTATSAVDIYRDGETELHVPAMQKKAAKHFPEFAKLLKTPQGKEQLRFLQVQAFPLEPKAERHLPTIK